MIDASVITGQVPCERLPHSSESDELQGRVALYLSAVRLELGKLGIWAQDGTIRLSGPVSSFYLRQLALSAASRVAGVRHIIDDIDVPIPIHHMSTRLQQDSPAEKESEAKSSQRHEC